MRLVYLSPVAWGFHAHRPHKFVEWFHHETGGEVLWVNPYPTRLPSRQDWRHLRRGVSAFSSERPSWLTLLQPKAFPIEPLPGARGVNRLLWRNIARTAGGFAAGGTCTLGIGKPCDLALYMIERIRVKKSFFDAIDDFPAVYAGISRKKLIKKDLAIVSKVDKLLTSSTAVMQRWRYHRRDAVLALNGCDPDGFSSAGVLERIFDANLLGSPSRRSRHGPSIPRPARCTCTASCPEQPDLNWAKPEVRAAMHATLRFWLDRGVDGFRADVVHNIGKHPALADVEPRLAPIPHCALNDEPVTHEYLREIRKLLDAYPGERAMVGEVFLLQTERVAQYYGRGDELNMSFNFPPLFAAWEASAWREQIRTAQRVFDPIGAWPTFKSGLGSPVFAKNDVQ